MSVHNSLTRVELDKSKKPHMPHLLLIAGGGDGTYQEYWCDAVWLRTISEREGGGRTYVCVNGSLFKTDS